MWTNEFEFYKSITTILDETATVSDVIITVEQDGYVFIEQESEDDGLPNTITLPPNMFREMLKALHTGEGAFRLIDREEG
jgi:hypothetical protein